MHPVSPAAADQRTWRFPRAFWIGNAAELFERAAFYGMFIALSLFLSRKIGFDDVGAGWVGALFSAMLYFLPPFMGAMADKIGFRRALVLAFALLTVGYGQLGASAQLPLDPLQRKIVAVLSLAIIVCGGAIVKPVISGTAAKCSSEANRARAFSIFYMVVNIGAFAGKTVARPLRLGFTLWDYEFRLGLEYINYYAALMAFCALVVVILFYRNVDSRGVGKSAEALLFGLLKVIANTRFMCLIVIVAGFWTIQGQLYASMPKYILRMVGELAAPEWLANINPLVVVALVVPVTHLIARWRPASAISVGLFIIPVTALVIALAPLVQARTGNAVSLGLLALHPITLMVCIGVGLQGLAECFLSPKFLEYASRQAPPGEVGLYLGYQHLTTFIAWLVGFVSSGYLLERYCPDPTTLSEAEQAARLLSLETGSAMPAAYANAHYLWYAYALVGVGAFCAMLIFKFVTDTIDRRRAAHATQEGLM